MPMDGPWSSVFDFVAERIGAHRDPERLQALQTRLQAGEVVLGDGTPISRDTAYQRGGSVYLYRDVRPEPDVPFTLTVLHQDDSILVVDKPHFLATMPRGRHVQQTVLTRVRRDLGFPDAAPAHRLDRLTAGVLVLTLRPEVRSSYQRLFAERKVVKTYRAVAPTRPELREPVTMRNRLVKERGLLQARVVPGEPNAETEVMLLREHVGLSTYRLVPTTGRTHQLRVHCAELGLPIVGDPLYPTVIDVRPDDFSTPLRLLAHRLEFVDPLTGEKRVFTSERVLRDD
ncbi:MAG: pseudouridine synthase [Ornithinimicrobium sp.]